MHIRRIQSLSHKNKETEIKFQKAKNQKPKQKAHKKKVKIFIQPNNELNKEKKITINLKRKLLELLHSADVKLSLSVQG